MTVPGRKTRPRFQREIDDAFLRDILRWDDVFITLAALATIDLTEHPEALDAICELVELRATGAPEHALQAWGDSARAYLLRLCDDEPVARPLAN